MKTKEFVWGSFPFTKSGFDAQARSPDIKKGEIACVMGLLDEPTKRQITTSVRQSSSNRVIGIFGGILPDGNCACCLVFATGKDYAHRSGAYGIHCIIESSTVNQSIPLRLQNHILVGTLKHSWTPEAFSKICKGIGLNREPDNSGERERASAWCEMAQRMKSSSSSAFSFAVINGKFFDTATSTAGTALHNKKQQEKSKRRISLILAAAIGVLLLGYFAFRGCPQKPIPPPPPPTYQDEMAGQNVLQDQQWKTDANKALASLVERWKLSTVVTLGGNPSRQFNKVLVKLLSAAPDKQSVQVLKKWVRSSNDDDVKLDSGKVELIQSIAHRVQDAVNITPPHTGNSYKDSLSYFQKVEATLLRKEMDFVRSNINDVLYSIDNEMQEKARKISLHLFETKIIEDKLLKTDNRTELLKVLKKHERFLNILLEY